VDLDSRLREALRSAMSSRDLLAVSALRSALGALGNATAVPADERDRSSETTSPHIAGAVDGLAGGEAQRRELSPDEERAIVEAEVADRRSAAEQMTKLGRADDSARLLAEAAVLQAVLDAEQRSGKPVTSLNSNALATLTAVSKPSYERSQASVGIVHFGFGNFHRSHQAMYLDRLMDAGPGMEWGICGVGILPHDAAMRDAMSAQDRLYTLVIRHPDGSLDPRVIGSVRTYLFGPDDPEAVFAMLVDPRVRIVSLTVTEGGYVRNPATGEFDTSDPAVAHDAANEDAPATAFGYIVEGLRRRARAGIPPFTVLSCDNLQGNGDVARDTVVGFARMVDPDLAAWIEANVSFPNCMVDRITPATTRADRDSLQARFGIDDRWPVPAEPFTQWIVEDDFPAGRPPLEDVGVQFVDDVKPYELMKLRLLNASHQAIAYWGAPLGYVLVDEAMRDELIRDFLVEYMAREAAPTLGELPGIDLEAYMSTLIDRFSNPEMRDTLVRLATDGSNRMATFTLPTIRANLEAGGPISLGAGMVAAWAHYWELVGRHELPQSEVPPDIHATAMTAAALAQSHNPVAFIEQRTLFGSLASDGRFREAFLAARVSIADRGIAGAIGRLLSDRDAPATGPA